MASNRLKLNAEKTQVIWLGTRQQLAKITVDALTLPHVTCSLTVTQKPRRHTRWSTVYG